jgi:benzoyl-CoA reductase/2-hydroxyglutaryl-CoA dehydratase subunit BcrC/BadD/HgdB
MTRKALRASIERYVSARMALRSLMESRSRRDIAAAWCMVMTNAFCMGDVDAWTNQVNQVLAKLSGGRGVGGARIFLAGSPVMFPNLKIPRLLEDAGLHVAADELCSSERTLAGLPVYEDDSEFAMLRALAEQSHQGCSCPTYADNSRRLDNIMATMRQRDINGLVLQLLKGCHPYDIGSFEMEHTLREHGFHFLRIETDHSREDSKSLLLRLEAFSEILGN